MYDHDGSAGGGATCRDMLGCARAFFRPTPSSSEQPRPVPWFVDPSELQKAGPSHHPTPTVPTPANLRPLPSDLPSTHPIAHLHAQLLTSPHLEHEYTIVRDPVPTDIGPPLAEAAPRGKRKRGKTNGGEGFGDIGMSPWRWIVVAQVKEGSENRGAIESVARIVRKSLLSAQPPLPLPIKRKREVSDGWQMIDAGEFAVHIVSQAAREQFFPARRFFEV
ncbi:hypothetical protein PHLGIDRAFT_29806 [Phlebiopsis gigantea 11061_1 CR5-6]|uniref:Uncharacterized protein n=1 Tax=Phlebiopsis gigantea (strain 11061_1 CR5-6) TaxID=745531 RepID=A0A0C3NS03_PHLG1|nr:hypothetical protein PHLGIDRAFT_29806 [Phlebiopsis gigantea 11061_1 CR5-6]